MGKIWRNSASIQGIRMESPISQEVRWLTLAQVLPGNVQNTVSQTQDIRNWWLFLNNCTNILTFTFWKFNCVYILVITYSYMEGCEQGIENCSQSRKCGNTSACSPCTYEECKDLAKASNSFAFSYLGAGMTDCMMCSENDLRTTITTHQSTWGIYAKGIMNKMKPQTISTNT